MRAYRVAMPGSATAPGVPAGDVCWEETVGTGTPGAVAEPGMATR